MRIRCAKRATKARAPLTICIVKWPRLYRSKSRLLVLRVGTNAFSKRFEISLTDDFGATITLWSRLKFCCSAHVT
jgi:hypothetical protein